VCTTPPVGPGESNFRPGGSVARRRSVSAARASQVVPATPPCRLSLRGERLHVAHAPLPSSRQSTGCATHLAHVNVCGLSLAPALPSLLLPSAALPSIASAPSLHTCIFPSVSVSCSTWPVSWQATEVHITETRVRCSRCNAELALAPYAPLAHAP
jgi:hypothetical protein